MDRQELDALLQQARAGERMARSLEGVEAEVSALKESSAGEMTALRTEMGTLRTEMGKLRGTGDRLAAWLEHEEKLAHEAKLRGPLAWFGDLFDNPKMRTLITATLAAAATAFVNWMMANAGYEPPAAQPPHADPPALSAPAEPQ